MLLAECELDIEQMVEAMAQCLLNNLPFSSLICTKYIGKFIMSIFFFFLYHPSKTSHCLSFLCLSVLPSAWALFDGQRVPAYTLQSFGLSSIVQLISMQLYLYSSTDRSGNVAGRDICYRNKQSVWCYRFVCKTFTTKLSSYLL